jgi:hypothetical protein
MTVEPPVDVHRSTVKTIAGDEISSQHQNQATRFVTYTPPNGRRPRRGIRANSHYRDARDRGRERSISDKTSPRVRNAGDHSTARCTAKAKRHGAQSGTACRYAERPSGDGKPTPSAEPTTPMAAHILPSLRNATTCLNVPTSLSPTTDEKTG